GYFRKKLEELQQKYPLIGEVRGMGMMQALELVRDRQTKEPAAAETNQIMERTRANGLLVGKGGMYANVIRMAPPMNISKADVDEGIRLLENRSAKFGLRTTSGEFGSGHDKAFV